MIRKRNFAQFIHLALILRLAITGLVLALAAAALTYYLRSDELADEVLGQATRHIDLFQLRTLQVSREQNMDSLKAAKSLLPGWRPDLLADTNGRFVLTKVMDLQGRILLEHTDPAFNALAASPPWSDGAEPRIQHGSLNYEMLRRGSDALIYVQAPVLNESGFVIAKVRSLYLLSEKTRAALRRDIAGSALGSFAIVLLTTLALYPVILLLLRRLERMAGHLLHSNLEMLQVIGSAIAKRDSETDAHNYRVSLYSAHLAQTLELSQAEKRRLLKGAFLHDVGKIGISDRILRKPGPLDPVETEAMRQHVGLGLEIIGRSHWLADAAEVVGNHHERLDGSGYPHGLTGNEIPLLARVFAIADVFDALCSVRPYKAALPLETSLELMRQTAGQLFDQKLFARFEEIARDLHARYAEAPVEALRHELGKILERLFQDTMDTLA